MLKTVIQFFILYVLMVLAQATYCIRIPYEMMIRVAGHYRQTQWSSIIESVINIVVSVTAVFLLGLPGVAVGTSVAVLYRLIYLVCYLRKNITYRKLSVFVRHVVIDLLSVAVIVVTYCVVPAWFVLQDISWLSWVILAIKISVVCVFESFLINLLLNIKMIKKIWVSILMRRKRI